MSKLAWVAGSKGAGYVLKVEPCPETAEFHKLNDTPFTIYRAAQDLANAIHLNAMRNRRKA